jgi:hypothetical protein
LAGGEGSLSWCHCGVGEWWNPSDGLRVHAVITR